MSSFIKRTYPQADEPFPVYFRVVQKRDGKLETLDSLGAARNQEEFDELEAKAKKFLLFGQLSFDDIPEDIPEDELEDERVEHIQKDLLWDALRHAYCELGFDELDDPAFQHMVLARVIEPSSILATEDVLTDIGIKPMHRNTYMNALERCEEKNYKQQVEHSIAHFMRRKRKVTLLLFDSTTLHFESQVVDDLRRPGYSKERRIDPQVVVSMLTDVGGFPLTLEVFPGDTAETKTFLPMVLPYLDTHADSGNMVVAADAGILSKKNLEALDTAGHWFVVGAKHTDVAKHLDDLFQRDVYAVHGQVEERRVLRDQRSKTVIVRSERFLDDLERAKAWRAIWSYNEKRARKDRMAIDGLEQRALDYWEGKKTKKKSKYLKIRDNEVEVDVPTIRRDRMIAGWKGCLTNIPSIDYSSKDLLDWYEKLWNIEASWRLMKHDLQARLFYHRTAANIKARMVVVFASLAVTGFIQEKTGVNIRRFLQLLKREHAVTISAGTETRIVKTCPPDETRVLLEKLYSTKKQKGDNILQLRLLPFADMAKQAQRLQK